MNETMTIQEAANVLKCSTDALYRAIRENKLRPRRWHRELHVTVEDLYKWRTNRYDRSQTKVKGKKIYNADKNRFSVTDAAYMLGVPAYTLHNMIRLRKISSTKIEKFHVLDMEQIDKAKKILEGRENKYRYS